MKNMVKSPSDAIAAAPRVLIASTAMLAFISFWQAAAVVLNDMGSSAFYAGAIAEHFIGKTAPWFILAIMILSFAVRSLYIESCSMFVRGGVYRVVKEAMGSTLAKFSVSALMFDYILTGPISGVSAGLYLSGLMNEVLAYFHSTVQFPVNATAAFFAILVVIVIADAARICVKAIRSRELLPTTEVPAEESQLRAPSGLFTREEEFEWAGR